MSDQNKGKNPARRRLLKSVVAGGGVFAVGRTLPESWLQPVVKSVLLPAHAQTSPFDGPVGNYGAAQNIASNERGDSILDMFVEPAQAIVVASVGNVSYEAYWTVRENDAVICGDAWYMGGSTIWFYGMRARSGNRLDDFSAKVGPVELTFSNQQVSGSAVDLVASTTDPGGPSKPASAPQGGNGCPINTSFLENSSSPYPDDELA